MEFREIGSGERFSLHGSFISAYRLWQLSCFRDVHTRTWQFAL